MSKRLIVFLVIISLLFSSCVTKNLWNKSYYQESIENFLITKDGKKLVIMGEKYDYIFDIDNELKNILISEYRKNILPVFDTFTLDEDNNIVGRYALFYEVKKYYDFKTRKEIQKDEKWLKENGFNISDRQFFYEKLTFKRIDELKGKRYATNRTINPTNKFNSKYYINIDEGKFANTAAERLIGTPITIAMDGVLVIGSVVLVAIVGGLTRGLIVPNPGGLIGDNFREDNYNLNLYRTEFNEKKYENNVIKEGKKVNNL